MRIYSALKIFFLLFLIYGCKKESFISGNYLFESDLTYISVSGDTFSLADREIELISDCAGCDILEFKYFYDAQNPEQKFKENVYVLHVFNDSVFGNWNITVGPEYPNGFFYFHEFFLEGNIFKDKKQYSMNGNIVTTHNNYKYSSWFSIKPNQ